MKKFIMLIALCVSIAVKGADFNEVKKYEQNALVVLNNSYIPFIMPALDMDEIKGVLETDDIVIYGLDTDGTLTTAYNLTPYPGFWMDKTGHRRDWANDGETVIGYAFANDHLEIYQMPGYQPKGTYGFNCYIVNEGTGNYVTVSVTLTLPTEVRKYDQTAMITTNNNYEPTAMPELDMEEIKQVLNTESFVIYALDENGTQTKNYTLQPFPGFWMDANGHVTEGTKDNRIIGFSFVEDHLEIYQEPNKQPTKDGHKFNCYIFNEETGEYVTVTITLLFSTMGDVNKDGKVDVADIATIISIMSRM